MSFLDSGPPKDRGHRLVDHPSLRHGVNRCAFQPPYSYVDRARARAQQILIAYGVAVAGFKGLERSIDYWLNSLSATVAIAGLFILGARIVTRSDPRSSVCQHSMKGTVMDAINKRRLAAAFSWQPVWLRSVARNQKMN